MKKEKMEIQNCYGKFQFNLSELSNETLLKLHVDYKILEVVFQKRIPGP